MSVAARRFVAELIVNDRSLMLGFATGRILFVNEGRLLDS